MRSFRRLLPVLVLVILSPLSWGEDVYYCVGEHNVALGPTDSGDTYELNRYKTERFTLKYEAGSSRLAIKSKAPSWGGDELYYLDCDGKCFPLVESFYGTDGYAVFVLRKGRFNYAASFSELAEMRTGTCTKF